VTELGPDEVAPVTARKVRVVLVDDHRLFRTGVRTGLGDAVDVLGEAETVDEAVALVRRTAPDVVLLDVHMPDGGGLAVLAALGQDSPATRFLALSVSDAAADVIAVVRAGARGYVTKNVSPEELLDAVRRVAEGDAVFSPRLAGFVLDAFSARDVAVHDEELDLLTSRERDVMRLIARGYTYREVAGELFLSVKTIETHVSSVLRKLQLSNRRELARWASDRRLV
jgi:DNA-binding NarL/FixJ family response regulator